MAWNQPDGNGSGPRPVGQSRRAAGSAGSRRAARQPAAPAAGALPGRLRRCGGSRQGGGGGGGVGGKGLRSLGTRGLGIIVALVLVGWGLAGIYIVEPAEEGVILRFGRYHETTGPGPHWAPYLIDSVEKVNVEQIRRAEIGYRTEAGDQSVPPGIAHG